jgi:hypothetical protein
MTYVHFANGKEMGFDIPSEALPQLLADVSCSHHLDPRLAVQLLLLGHLGHDVVLRRKTKKHPA